MAKDVEDFWRWLKNSLPLPQAWPIFQAGEVWLVGAGPGDAGLLTLHALNALRQADYILYDALVSEECLAYASPKAKLSFVGKRAGRSFISQTSLTAQLVALAKEGHRVMRFKGGDPCFFGRGVEEALALQQASIPYRIIPGISAGLAAPLYAGLTLTKRGIHQNILFLTGHDKFGNLPNFDWPSLAKGASVLVFYMGLRHSKEIVTLLLKEGRPASEDIVFIADATTIKQKTWHMSLEEALEFDTSNFSRPMLIIIGPQLKPFLQGKQRII